MACFSMSRRMLESESLELNDVSMPQSVSILLVDDDLHLATSMTEWLRELGHQVDMETTKSGAIAKVKQTAYQLVLTDLRLGDDDGFDLIALTKKHHPETAVMVMTGYATPDTAVQAVRAGAFDLLTKPLIDDELTLAIDRAVSQAEVTRENKVLREKLDKRAGLENILSHDYRMLKIFDVIDSVADARASILITGENGTGKSMIARAIHSRSSRRNDPFVEVACGALPDNLLESELFGHVAGAYTGANTDRTGKFELADGGTLFLDEIGTATPAMQVKLLRVLQELQFEPLGGSETKTVDTRVVLATNEDLVKNVSEGTFRQDLYYRINVVNIVLPSLRERAGDIPLLADHFIREAAETCDRDIDGFSADAIAAMQAYNWPGNIRQLQNVIRNIVVLHNDVTVELKHLPPPLDSVLSEKNIIPPITPEISNAPHLHAQRSQPADQQAIEGINGHEIRPLVVVEKEAIELAINFCDGNIPKAAALLEVSPSTIYRKKQGWG